MMKKLLVLCFTGLLLCMLSACGGKDAAENDKQQQLSYDTPLQLLEEVVAAYKENELFAMYGGDQEHAVMDAPGSFAISKTQELDAVLGLPESQWQQIDAAASLVHMMNANTFTGAAYRLKNGADKEAFVDAVKANVQAKQWICGQPDLFFVMEADGAYMITAFGNAELIHTFRDYALSVLKDARVVTEGNFS